MTKATTDARALLTACCDGVLATISVAVAGYPFGSVVPYCLDHAGAPLILIAGIAQHTRNVRADGRVSLTVFDRAEHDLQAAGRVTLLGSAERLEADSAAVAGTRYKRFFPAAADYESTHDFSFWRIVPHRLRFIGGFGEIHWLAPDQVMRPNPFDDNAERGIIEHMNADHAEAIIHYCLAAGVEVPAGVTPVMAGCDGEGIHIRIGARLLRIPFATPVTDMISVRATLVAMARR